MTTGFFAVAMIRAASSTASPAATTSLGRGAREGSAYSKLSWRSASTSLGSVR